ncbi:MAG: ORF6N domain-containing protein, partial [Candidatus Omnitrophica bacterium]|nr:ORF6N domain-containing protein [Candidatus Omnitrophota bacterium]
MQALFGYLGALRRVQGLTNRFSFNDEQELPALLAQGRRFQGNILRVNHSVYPQKGFSTKLERGIFYVSSTLVVKEVIEDKIFLIHGHKVMVDRDLAQLYGVPTKVLNQAVKRNKRRFPTDFMFPLTKKEAGQLVTNCDRFRTLKHSSALPRVFTEQGVAMLSAILRSETAIKMSIKIIK